MGKAQRACSSLGSRSLLYAGGDFLFLCTGLCLLVALIPKHLLMKEFNKDRVKS